MARRISTHPLWILCCCGCLGPLALIKGALAVGPVLLFVVLAYLVIGLAYFLWFIPMVFVSILLTNTWRLPLKFFCLIGMWIPLALFLPAVLLVGVALGLAYGFFGIWKYTFDDEFFWFGGWLALASDVWGLVEALQQRLSGFLDRLAKFRTRALFPTEEPWDLQYIWLVVCVLVGAAGLVVVFPLWFLLATAKLIPAILRTYYNLWRAFFEEVTGLWMAMCFPVFILVNALLPVACLLLYAVTVVHGVICGLYSAVVCYGEDSVGDAFVYMCAVVRRFDYRTNQRAIGHFCGFNPDRSFLDLCCRNLDKAAKVRVDAIVVW